MDQHSEEFAAKLLATFHIEAKEHIKLISDGLLALEEKPDPAANKEIIETIFREAHSLKGAARAVNLISIQDACQSLENVLAELKAGRIALNPDLINTIYQALDGIGRMIDSPSGTQEESKLVMDSLMQKMDEASNQHKNSPPTTLQEQEELAPKSRSAETTPEKSTIRVFTQKLDKLMQEVEEMLILKLVTGQRLSSLQHIFQLLKQGEKKWNRMQKELRQLRLAHENNEKNYVPTKDFLNFIESQQSLVKDAREKSQSLLKMYGQDYRLVGGMVDGLLDDTKKVLMQPFSSLFELFPRMVRDIASSLGKKVKLIMSGGDIEVDRRILEEMKDPLIHLIRNSIDHGIESPEERIKMNKTEEGHIILSAMQTSGNTVEISVCDDGRGLDIEKIKKAAIKQGYISENDAASITTEDAAKLLFKSGISTSPLITEFSGRGLGVGIVNEKVEKFGGVINIEFTKDVGTTFKISLPLTMATFRGVHIQASGQDFILPSHNLQRVIRLSHSEIQTVEGQETIKLNGKFLSYIHLSHLLNLPINADEKQKNNFLYITIIKNAGTILALGVDKILNEQEIFIKGLGKQLARVKFITAATIMEWGKVIPILDPFDITRGIDRLKPRAKAVETTQEKELSKKIILVAEDSVTARILLKNILESVGYEVKTAVDGAEALTIIKTEKIDLLVSDIEMPRLTGLELTEKIRSDPNYKELPVILCTSRGSREDKERGIEVGANAYLIKSEFAQSNLVEIIKKLL